MTENQKMALSNWRSLLKVINDMSEEELRQCVVVEATNNKRLDMIKRMYKRYAAMRKQREMFELSICITKSLEE